jgi:hypothetical protein
MSKTRQRERKRRPQADAVTVTSAGASWSEAVRIADAVFRLLAEKAAAQSGLSVEDELKDAWSLFKLGRLRLVARDDGGHLGVELCESRAEQRAQAGKNRRLVEFKRQVPPQTIP